MQKVLFIHDGERLLNGLEQGLEAAGVAVFLADGVGNGLKVLREVNPDAVVVGVGERVGSLDFLSTLKSTGRVLILVRGGNDPSCSDSVGIAPVDAVLPTSVSSEELCKTLVDLWKQQSFHHYGEISDQALVTVLEETRDFVILADERLQEIFYVNAAARKVLGILQEPSGEAREPRALEDIYPEDTFQNLLKSIQESLGQGRMWRGEAWLYGISGEAIPVSQQVHIHDDISVGSRFVSLVIRDITALKKTQETLEKQEEFYRLITENTSDLVGLFDPTGQNVYSSPSYAKLLGFGSWELEGQGIYDCIHHDDRERVRNIVLSTIESGKEVVLQYRMMNKSGAILHFEATTGGIRNEQGHFERLIFVSRDITTQVQQREERKLLQLHNLHAQKMESIGQLAAGVAHEMNTPIQYFGDNLRFIRDSFSDLIFVLKAYHAHLQQIDWDRQDSEKLQELRRTWEEVDAEFLFEEIPKSIDQSLQGVTNLSHIVGAMKEFSHPGSDNKIPINFNTAIENTLTIARSEWKYIADIALELDPALPPVHCLPDEIRQVLLNLVINACHAIEEKGLSPGEKGRIQIKTRLVKQDDLPHVELSISDSGTGIPEDVRARIFEPFFTTKAVGKGTGQGLAIVHNVVIDKHSGRLHVESELNEGTTFIIVIPLNLPQNTKSE